MYQWNPGDYERNSSGQEEAAKSILSGLRLSGDEHILDIGCGDGRITAKMAGLVPRGRVVGIDSSREMVDFARKKFSACPNLTFEQGDACNLGFEGEFDLVTSFACLHWVKDHLAVLRGIKRSLKPGGRMIIQCGGRGRGEDIFSLARAVVESDKWGGYFRGYTNPHGVYGPVEYHAWLRDVGLQEVSVDLSTRDMVLPGKAGLEGFIRTTWLSLTERIPDEMKAQFISEISDKYLDMRPLQDGKALVGMAVLRVEARNLDK